MADPVGVTRTTCTAGTFTGIESEADLGATITATSSAPELVWAANGNAEVSDPITVTCDAGMQATIALIPTDLDGWLINGSPVDVSGGKQSHTYTITIQPFKVDALGRHVPVGKLVQYVNVAIPSGVDPIDLDTLVPWNATTGVTVSIPGELPGQVAAAEAAATAAAASAGTAAAYRAVWVPSTAYAAGTPVIAPDGSVLTRISAGTSRATFDATEKAAWNVAAATSGTMEKTALDATYIAAAQKGAASGVASLDAGTKIPIAQVPLSTSAGDFVADGAAAAGSTGKVADAGHRHPTDTTLIPLSQKAAASGVASLDAGTKIPIAQVPTSTSAADFVADGTASAGSVGKVADAGHRHPTDTTRAADTAVVHNTGAETVAGVKTFSSSPVVPTPSSGANTTSVASTAYADRNIGAVGALGNMTGAISLTSYTAQNQVFTLTATGNLTLAPSGMPAIVSGMAPAFILKITQDGTGSRTLTLTSIKAAGGVQPALSTAANAVDFLAFMYDGTNWIVTTIGKAFA